jgi:hypothetical protein
MVLQGRGARMPRYSLWALVRLPAAWGQLVRAASLTMVLKVAAHREAVEDREATEDDLLCHRFPETVEKEQQRPKRPVQPP